MNADPLASMRLWAVDVEMGGRTYTIPPLPASEWWGVLLAGDPFEAVLELIPPVESSDLDELLLDGTIAVSEMTGALTDAIEQITGRTLQAGIVLAGAAAMHWPVVNGRLARSGFRWDVMPIGAALDAIYAMIVENQDEETRAKFEALIDPEAAKQKQRAEARAAFAEMAGPPPTPAVTSAGPSSGSRPRTERPSRPRHPRARSSEPT